MNRTTILAIGQHDFLQPGQDWKIVVASGTEEAIEKFQQSDFDVVVFANDTDTIKLQKLFSFQQPGIILLQDQNDDLIVNAIQEALDKKQMQNKPSISFVDDALQAAMLPITIQ